MERHGAQYDKYSKSVKGQVHLKFLFHGERKLFEPNNATKRNLLTMAHRQNISQGVGCAGHHYFFFMQLDQWFSKWLTSTPGGRLDHAKGR